METSPWQTWLAACVLRLSAASYDAYLQRHGYSPGVTHAYRHAVGHFAHWLTEEQLEFRRLDESVVRRFLSTHLPECRCSGRCQRTVLMVQPALTHLLRVLRADRSIAARCGGMSPTIHDELARFIEHLDHVGGLAAKLARGAAGGWASSWRIDSGRDRLRSRSAQMIAACRSGSAPAGYGVG